MSRKKILLLGLLILLIPSAYALSILSIPSELVSIFGGKNISNSSFALTSLQTTFQGKNKMTIQVTLQNTDTSAHSANVTIQALDSSGNIIEAGSQLTGTVSAGSSVTLVFSFSVVGIINTYDSPLVQVRQTA